MLFGGGAKVTTDCLLAGQEIQQIFEVWMKKTHLLLSEQIFFINSSDVTKYMGNVNKSQLREENNWVDSGECLIITQNYCGTHLQTHTHVHPPASVKGRRLILALNRDTSVTL